MRASRAGFLVVAVALIAGAVAGSAWAKGGPPPAAKAHPTTLLVGFKSEAAAGQAIASQGDRSIAALGRGVRVVQIRSNASLDSRLAEYRARADVAYAELNFLRTKSVPPPNDPSFGSQWGLAAIHAVPAWTIHPGSFASGGGPKIAVVDTGVHSPHADLVANVDTASGADCAAGVCTADAGLDEDGHGTHVAGIAAAATNNGLGIAGVAFSSQIVPIDVFAGEFASDAGVVSGMAWAVARGVRVINLSLGGYGAFPTTLCNAVSSANAAGVLIVAAAGNDGTTTPSYPAACPGAIGIAATDFTDGSPDFSNWNAPNVFISAPGEGIYSTYWNGDSTFETLTGTSMAAPHIAGVAALLFGQNSARSPGDVKQLLAQTASKVGANRYPPLGYGSDPYGTCGGCTWHPYYGYGLVDAAAALAAGAPAPTLTSFSPMSGEIGSTIQLMGSDLGQVTGVSLGNQPASFVHISATRIDAVVPAAAAQFPTVRWRLHYGASGVALHDTPFVITGGGPAVPTIGSFAPASGAVGSQVMLTGTNFVDVSAVTLNFVAAAFTVDSPTQITATVPAGLAPNGYRWRVTTPAGTAVHNSLFTVTVPSTTPTFSSFAPGTGPVGAIVTLTGTNLGQVTQVTLGNVNAAFTLSSPTEISAIVPAGAAAYPTVRWRLHWASGGVALHDTPFVVLGSGEPPPTITGFNPASGPVGADVVLTGASFVAVGQVSLGNVLTTFLVNSPTQITAQVPGGLAPDGYRWRVATPAGTAVNASLFTITVPSTTPTFTGFAPGSGAVGSQVVLTGTNFGQVTQVSLGNVNAAFTLDSPTQITAAVPAGGAAFPTVRWRVHWASGGVALHDTPFVITGGGPAVPTIGSFAPGSGPVGSQVVLTGTNFVDVSAVTLNFVAAVFTVDSPTQITATVPAGLAPNGYRWRVTTPAGTAVNNSLFTVTVPSTTPTFTSFAPASGAVGSTVVLTGTNFGQVTQVTLGNVNAAFTLDSPTQITATVPAGAAVFPTVRWRVHWASGGVALHDTPFGIVPPTTLKVDSSGNFDYVDPALSYFTHSWQMQDVTCARLVSYPDTTTPASGAELVPEVAAALPTISPDGKTYTFQIRPGFAFSPPSTQTVTAATFEASFERVLDPALQSPGASFIGDVASIDSSGDLLTITLDEPAGDLLARLAMPFFCPVPIGTPAAPVGAPLPSAGPYYLVSWDSAVTGSAVAVRNPNYGGTRVRSFDRIEWTLGKSLDDIKTRVETGVSDTGPIPPAAAEDLHARFGPGSPAAAAGRQRYFLPANQVFWYLALNTERVFANEKLRQAVAFALDREHMASLHGFDGGTATDQYLTPGMPGYVDHDLYPLGGNLAEAQRLATESGATPATVKLYTFSTSPGPAIAAYVQTALAPLGITVVIETFTRVVQHEKMATRGEAFDMGPDGWGADYLDPFNFLDVLLNGSRIQPTNNVNVSYFNNATFNARFDAARALTGAARTTEYADLDHDLATASPLVPYLSTSSRLFFSDRIGCHQFKSRGVALNALCLRP